MARQGIVVGWWFFGAIAASTALLGTGCMKKAVHQALWGAPPPVMHFDAPPPVPGAHWMSKDLKGGPQCPKEGAQTFDWKKLRYELTGAGIHWDQKIIDPHPVCTGCQCPSYSVTVRLRVRPTDLEVAKKVGFTDLNAVPPELTWRRLAASDDPEWKASAPMGVLPIAVTTRVVGGAEQRCIFYKDRFAWEGGHPREVRIYKSKTPNADFDITQPTACDEERGTHEITLHAGDDAEPDLAGIAGDLAAVVWHRTHGSSNVRLLKIYDLTTQNVVYRARVVDSAPLHEADAFTFARVVALREAGVGERLTAAECNARRDDAWREARERFPDLTSTLSAPECRGNPAEARAPSCALKVSVLTRFDTKARGASRASKKAVCAELRSEGPLPDEVH